MPSSDLSSPARSSRRSSALALTPIALALTVAGCTSFPSDRSTSTPSEHASSGDHASSWSYSGATGPDAWGLLDADFGLCSSGLQQSPIDLPSAPAVGGEPFTLDYRVTTAEIENNGHTTQVDPDHDQLLHRAGVTSELAQMHFHAPAEHTVDGVQYDAEFHFVHQDDHDHLTVVGVFAIEGAETPSWNTFIDAAATPVGEERDIEVDLGALLPAELGFDDYSGSLTTPPCSEDVDWIVLTTPVTLSAEQLDKLEAAHVGNNRPTQGLGHRTVGEGLAVVQ